jgi:large subunit ribosomal protein L11|mmetsp:Transcript_10841/g.33670  ORF Transcript_10841/g.33670 Transcript_10841/m.33670 type:complete len:156 (-) Transcript_10841:2215-2682(-)
MAGRVLQANVRLLINAGGAKPAPPVGPALGQQGVNIMAFCKDFNARTADLKPDVPVRVKLTVFKDKSFDIELRTPPTTFFLKKAARIEAGAREPGQATVGVVSVKQVYEIARMKSNDPENKGVRLQDLSRAVAATAKSMGIAVKNFRPAAAQAAQ